MKEVLETIRVALESKQEIRRDTVGQLVQVNMTMDDIRYLLLEYIGEEIVSSEYDKFDCFTSKNRSLLKQRIAGRIHLDPDRLRRQVFEAEVSARFGGDSPGIFGVEVGR